jgi:hypothetical protein
VPWHKTRIHPEESIISMKPAIIIANSRRPSSPSPDFRARDASKSDRTRSLEKSLGGNSPKRDRKATRRAKLDRMSVPTRSSTLLADNYPLQAHTGR